MATISSTMVKPSARRRRRATNWEMFEIRIAIGSIGTGPPSL